MRLGADIIYKDMGVRTGFGKIPTSGLVHAIDVNDFNSYKGPPLTNLVTQMGQSSGNQNGTYFKTQYSIETKDVPQMGRRSVHSIVRYNDYSGGSGICCHQVFALGGGAVTGGAVYTYSIVYRTQNGMTHPNFMYQYQYGPSGYITEGGKHSDSNRIHLGDGWYWAWGVYTMEPASTSTGLYFYEYEYATWNKIEVAGIMLVRGDYRIPPEFFLQPGGSYSDSQNLTNLTSSTNHSTSRMTYNQAGKLAFDGASTRIDIEPDVLTTDSDYTIVAWLKPTNLSSQNYSFPLYNTWNSDNGFWHHYVDNGYLAWRHYGGSNGGSSGELSGHGMQNGVWGMTAVRFSFGESRLSLFANGVKTNEANGVTGYASPGAAGGAIGMLANRGNSNDYNYNGELAKHLIYNRPLSDDEILQIYHQTRSKFSL
jgi:hypothetical protein